MPGIGGIEASRRIASRGIQTVVVLITGDDSPYAARDHGAA